MAQKWTLIGSDPTFRACSFHLSAPRFMRFVEKIASFSTRLVFRTEFGLCQRSSPYGPWTIKGPFQVVSHFSHKVLLESPRGHNQFEMWTATMQDMKWTLRGSNPGTAKTLFLFFQSSRPALRPPEPLQWLPALFGGGKSARA